MVKSWGTTAFGLVILAMPAQAEFELGLYGGYQTAPHSNVSGTRADSSSFDTTVGWDGKSFEMPPYYGLRGTWWNQNNIGFGLEFTHAKVYAVSEDMPDGFTRLELTDGLNLFTINVLKRWPGIWSNGRVTPYVGGGIGLAMPHVDVTENDNVTFGYQVSGPAVRLLAGVSYAFNEDWAIFGEYQFSYSENDVDLEGGGDLQTDVITNALNIGFSYTF